MQVGRYRVSVQNHGFFRLDGGAMFGSVPKTLWAQKSPPDENNRILLATRSIVIEDGDRRMIVDAGCGDKWSEKSRAIYCIAEGAYVPIPDVTDVLLTHLHFDHAGGISRLAPDSNEPIPTYAKATHFVPASNLENARTPNVRERASYLAENYGVLTQIDLRLIHPEEEIWPGLTVHESNGHTRGLVWVTLTDGGTTVAFPADLVPTSNHVPIPYVMGYDIFAGQSMQEKEVFLKQAMQESWIVVFEHDPLIASARIALDERGNPCLGETVDL